MTPIYRLAVRLLLSVLSIAAVASASTMSLERYFPPFMPYQDTEEVVAFKRFGLPLYRSEGTVSLFSTRGSSPEVTAVVLNSVRINDPYTGLPFIRISPTAASSALFSGDPRSGSKRSGVSDVPYLATRPPLTRHWPVFIEGVSDNLAGNGYDHNWYRAATRGHIRFLEHTTVSGVVERRYLGDRQPSTRTGDILPDGATNLPGNWLDGWSYNAKLDLLPSRRMLMRFSLDGSHDEYSHYLHNNYFNWPHLPYYKDQSLALTGQWFHQFAGSYEYSLLISTLGLERFRGDGEKKEDLAAYPRPFANPWLDEYQILYSWDNPDSVTGDIDESHYFDDYKLTRSRQWTIGGELDGSFSPYVNLKLGGKWLRTTQRVYHNMQPTITTGAPRRSITTIGYDLDGEEVSESDATWQQKPWKDDEITVYLKSTLARSGLRLLPRIEWRYFGNDGREPIDYLRPTDPYETGDSPTTIDLEDTRETGSHSYLAGKFRLSVEIARNLSIISGARLEYYRQPLEASIVDWQQVEEMLTTGTYFAIGSPSAEPRQIREMEIGLYWQDKFGNRFSTALFTRKEANRLYPQVLRAWPVAYGMTAFSVDRETEGVELSTAWGPTRGLSLSADFTYWTSQTSDFILDAEPDAAIKIGGGGRRDTYPTRHDNLVLLRAQVQYSLFRDEGLRVGGIHPFERSTFAVALLAHSGYNYTPVDPYDAISPVTGPGEPSGPINSERTEAIYRVDLSFKRRIQFGESRLVLSLWVRNLFNRENIHRVYPGTGEPDETGYLSTPEGLERIASDRNNPHPVMGFEERYLFAQNDPHNYGRPRQIMLGLQLVLD